MQKPLHLACEGEQMTGVHAPALQAVPAPQTLPQAPQLASSVARFTQLPPQVDIPMPQLPVPLQM